MKNKIITPYIGVGNIKLSFTLKELRTYLKKNNIKYNIENWSNKGCDPEIAWDIVRIDGMSFFFAKNKMFKIYIEKKDIYQLENGIKIKMTIEDAMKIDNTLLYNDDGEDYESKMGYWIEESLETGLIESITIFIKELEDEDVFYSYEWCN